MSSSIQLMSTSKYAAMQQAKNAVTLMPTHISEYKNSIDRNLPYNGKSITLEDLRKYFPTERKYWGTLVMYFDQGRGKKTKNRRSKKNRSLKRHKNKK